MLKSHSQIAHHLHISEDKHCLNLPCKSSLACYLFQSKVPSAAPWTLNCNHSSSPPAWPAVITQIIYRSHSGTGGKVFISKEEGWDNDSQNIIINSSFIAHRVDVTLGIFQPHHYHVGSDPGQPRHAAIFVTVTHLFVFTKPRAFRISSPIHVK